MFEEFRNIRLSFKRQKLTPGARQEARIVLLLISPWIIGFLVFTLIPMIATLTFSFADLKITSGILSPVKFVGLKNYTQMFQDQQVWDSLGITLKYGLFALPVSILAPLGIAMLMNAKSLKGAAVIRSLFYMPYIVPFVAAVFIWGGMLNPSSGWINQALAWLGAPKESLPGWTDSTTWVYPAYVIMGIWGIGNTMLIMLSGLQGVPTELYDAAKVDGAGWWKTQLNVTLPMISPVIFYNLVLSMVTLFQFFLVPLVFNKGTGEPGGATMFYNLYLDKTFFTYQNMSYGAAMAWLLFMIILLVTMGLFATAKYWVYYPSER